MAANGFKETDIGVIPEDWNVHKLKEIAFTTSGGTPSRQRKEFYIGDIPWVKSGELNDNYIWDTEEKITQEAIDNSSAKWLNPETLLIAMYGATVGKTAILKIRATTNQAVCSVVPNDKINTDYLRYYFVHIRPHLLNSRYGGAQPNINQTILKDTFVLCPLRHEQDHIAYILQKLQQAIAQQEKIIAKTKELKRSLMHRLFTYGLRGEELKETEIGLMPENWEVVRFDDLADFKNGINFNIGQKGGKGILTIDVLNMYGERIDANLNNLYRVDIDLSNKSDYILRGNDILFVRSSLKREGVGWVSLFKEGIEPVTFCGFIIRARIKSDISLAEYLTYFFRSDVARKKLISSERVAITNINQGMLRSFLVPLPKIEEQQEIVDILTKVEDKLGQSQSRKQALQELFKTMLQLLMTGQVRVKDIDFGEACE